MGSIAKGFILRSVDYGDSDLIFEFLNQDGSLISFKARGARASKKRFSGGVLEPLQYIELHYENKPGKAPLLLEAKILEAFDSIRQDYDKIHWSTKIMNVTQCYSQEGLADPSLFNLLGNAIKRIAKTTEPVEHVFWHFLVRLMAMQGDLQRSASLGAFLQCSMSQIPEGEINLAPIKRDLRKQFRELFERDLSEWGI